MSSIFHSSNYFDLNQYEHANLFKDCRYVWEALNRIQSYILSYQAKPIDPSLFPQSYLVHPELIYIGEGTTIEPGAYIQGPCILGKKCVVRHGAYLRGEIITGDQCIIGHDTEVKSSIFLNKTAAAHFAYVGDSILGNCVNLGAGTKCANLRLDRGLIKIHYQSETYATERKKLGAIIGDYAQLGCNAVTNPGTLLGPFTCIAPCLNVGGVVPDHSYIHQHQNLLITSLKKELQ